MDVSDKIIVVTGGASGIGEAMAERFIAEGARHVVIADRASDAVAAVAGRIGAAAMACDVTDEAAVEALIDDTERRFGPIDLFCANAGIGAPGGAEASNDAWQAIWEVNVMAHVYAARHLIPRMTERGGGHLLFTASAAGLLTNLGTAPYSVTKHAAVGFAEWIAISHADDGIGVSCLCPQGVRTPMILGASDDPSVQAVVAQGAIDPAECAQAVVDGLAAETFLILPHPEVARYFQNKANDYDRWIGGMQRLNRQFSGG